MQGMTGYWWQCDNCGYTQRTSPEGLSVASYILDVIFASEWDQSKLSHPCSTCGKGRLRITYDYEGTDYRLSVTHMVGLDDPSNLQMLWETKERNDPKPWFDFHYLKGRNARNLNRTPAFFREDLKRLFQEYQRICGGGPFP